MKKQQLNITFAHRILLFAMLLSMSVFTSCSSDLADGSSNGNGGPTGLFCSADSKVFDEDGSRSSLTLKGGNMAFAWDGGDIVTAFADESNTTKCEYTLTSGSGSTLAEFTGLGFDLSVGKRYYALSKAESTVNTGCGTSIPDKRNITLSYEGQRQTGNASSAHLGKYDYMVASAICTEKDNAHFSFKHLGFTMRLVIDGDATFKSKTFNKLEIYDGENTFLKPRRPFSFPSTGELSVDDSYSPAWPNPAIGRDDARFSMELDNIQPSTTTHDGTTNTARKLILYMELPPVDLSGKIIGFVLTAIDDSKYFCTAPGKNMMMEKAYQYNLTATQTTDYTVTIKVNQDWQHGNTKELSRATGDPGLEDKFQKPKYLYIYYCHDGKVKEKVVKENIPESDWDKKDNILTYAHSQTFQNTGAVENPRVYVFASMQPVNIGVAVHDLETKIQDAKYSIYNPTDQIASQAFLKDLYSTPWTDAATFEGNLSDPYKDIFLYHTAAKVDLKWNSETEMTVYDSEADDAANANAYIKVTEVQKENLSLFKPTTNNGTGDYTVTTPITYGTFINGRQVYYLPQFTSSNCNYKVTIGAKTGSVSFTPTTTGGYTSWLRALITQTAPVTP